MAINVNVERDDLSWEEAETKSALEKSGKTVYYAPIEIVSRDQLDTLGITWNQCRTWRFGNKSVIVHLTPCDEETYSLLFHTLQSECRKEYRNIRCLVPGKQKPIIRCPETRKCSACLMAENRRANLLSFDELADGGTEEELCDPDALQPDIPLILESVLDAIGGKNPKYRDAILMKEYYGFSVAEIAEIMNDTERNVYFYISEAKKIGKKNK